ncbi:MAG: protein kinase [Planctomycetota bacterium]
MANGPSGESSRTAPPQVLNKEIGDFTLLERVGEGGMGTVFKATQKSLNRLVAVKVLSPKVAKDPVFIERFRREAKAAAALNHPNIVRAIAVGETQGLHYFAMELLEGETARQRLERSGPLPLMDVLEIGRQTALALAHAHRKSLLHRDIKPENLMLLPAGEGLLVKVMDLGLARLVHEDASLTQAGIAIGTPLYTSPEQARGVRELTPACDLYALGATLFHLATGQPPFTGASAVEIMTQHVQAKPPDPKKLNPALPEEFCALLLQLLAKKPQDRCESAAALAEDFQTLIDEQKSPAAGEAEPEDDDAAQAHHAAAKGRTAPKRRPLGRRGKRVGSGTPVPVGAAIGGAVLCVILVLFFLTKNDNPVRGPDAATPKAVAQPGKTGAQPENSPTDPVRQQLDELVAAALNVEKARPDDLEAQYQAWTDVKRAGTGRRQGAEAGTKLLALDGKFEAAEAKAISDALTKSKDQAAKGEYHAALALLDSFPPQSQHGAGKEHIQTAIADLRAKATADGNALLQHAAGLETAGDRQAALKEYTAAARFKYEPIAKTAADKAEALQGALDLDAKEALAAKAWEDAEGLFAKKKYEAAQPAYLAFKTGFKGTKTLADKSALLDERLAAIEAEMNPQPRTETTPEPKPQAKTEAEAPQAVKEAWKSLDIGKATAKGSFTERAGIITVKAAGADIGGNADSFLYVYQPLEGDGEITAQVAGVEATHLSARAGVMIRETLTPDSKHLTVAVSSGKGVLFQERASSGGVSKSSSLPGTAPSWVRLVRSGNTFTGLISGDGATWRPIGTATFLMSQTAYIGLAVTSYYTGVLNTSMFDKVAVTKPDQAANAAAAPAAKPDASAPKPAASAAKLDAPTEASWAKAVNVLPYANPARDAIAGNWRLQAGKLFSDKHKNARLELPYQPPEEYDVRMTFSRFAGEDEIVLILSKAGRSFAWVMGGSGGTVCGIESVGGQVYDKNDTTVKRGLSWPKLGEKHSCTVQVRNDCLRAFLDEEQVLDYKTDFKEVWQGKAGPWKLSREAALGIGSAQSPTHFLSVEVLEITGKGKLTH